MRSPRPLALIIGVCVGAMLIMAGAVAAILFAPEPPPPPPDPTPSAEPPRVPDPSPTAETPEPRPILAHPSDTLVAERLGLVAPPADFEESRRYAVKITDYERIDRALGVERPTADPSGIEVRKWLRAVEASPFADHAPYSKDPSVFEPSDRGSLAFDASALIEPEPELLVHDGDFTPDRLDDFADREADNLWSKGGISYLTLQDGALYDAGYDESLLPDDGIAFEDSLGADASAVRVAELADGIEPFSLRLDTAPYLRGGIDYDYDRPDLLTQALAVGADGDRLRVRMVFDHVNAAEAKANLAEFEEHAEAMLPGKASTARHGSMIAIDFTVDPDEDLTPLVQEFGLYWALPYRF